MFVLYFIRSFIFFTWNHPISLSFFGSSHKSVYKLIFILSTRLNKHALDLNTNFWCRTELYLISVVVFWSILLTCNEIWNAIQDFPTCAGVLFKIEEKKWAILLMFKSYTYIHFFFVFFPFDKIYEKLHLIKTHPSESYTDKLFSLSLWKLV